MNKQLSAKIEALLAYKQEPMHRSDIASACDAKPKAVQRALAKLKDDLTDRGLTIVETGDAVQLTTDPEFGNIIRQQYKESVDTNLTEAQSEALSVIAYLAPVTKPTIDFVRGVNSRAVLRNLSTRGLVDTDRSGQQTSFTPSAQALRHLGISKREELPKYEETKKRLEEFIATNRSKDQ